MDTPNPFSPSAGLADNLMPHPPAGIPEAHGAGDAVQHLSPFSEPQDVESIIKNLVLDRPLKLFIPNKHLYPDHEFRIINSIPHEIAAAHNKGFREVTNPELFNLFRDLVAGTDKDGKAFRPILCARPKAVGRHIQRQHDLQLQSLYAGMDPKNKDFEGKYTGNVDKNAGTFGQFSGAGFRIRVR